MLSPRHRGGNRVELAGIEIKQAPTALTIEQGPFAYLVPKLGPQRHLAREAPLPGRARQRSLTRGRSDAVVLRKQGVVNPFSDRSLFLLENSELVLEPLGGDACPFLFRFHLFGLAPSGLAALSTRGH